MSSECLRGKTQSTRGSPVETGAEALRVRVSWGAPSAKAIATVMRITAVVGGHVSGPGRGTGHGEGDAKPTNVAGQGVPLDT